MPVFYFKLKKLLLPLIESIMKKIGFFLLLIGLSFAATTGYAQAKQKETKKSEKKKAEEEVKPVGEEKIEEIIEDQAISTRPGSREMGYPVKNYDTTGVPNDAVSVEMYRLVDEMKLVDMAMQTAKDAVVAAKTANQNMTPELLKFYDRFTESLNGPEVRAFYRTLFVKLYRKYYTVEEMKEVQKFYQTAVGKKTLKVMSPLMQESMQEGGNSGRTWRKRFIMTL